MTQQYSIDTFPRTLEACNALSPSQRFGYMNRIGALSTHEAKQAFGAADSPSQAQALLEAFMNYDQQRQNGQLPPTQTQPQQPMQLPYQQPPQMPQGAPPMPAQLPQMMAPPQMPQAPTPQPGFSSPQMGVPPQMPPQMGQPAQMGMPQMSAPPMPAQPYGQQPMGMPQMAPPQMGMPPMMPPQMTAPPPPPQSMPQMAPPQPGQMALPNVTPPMVPTTPSDGREPAAPTSTGKGKSKGAAATGDASAAILKRLADNNEEIINTLSSVATGSMNTIEALQEMHKTLLGVAQVQNVMLVILVEFYKAMAQKNLQEVLPFWYQSLHSNTGQQVLQYLNQQPGKG